MLAFSNDYYGLNFRAKQSVELFCAYFIALYSNELKIRKLYKENPNFKFKHDFLEPSIISAFEYTLKQIAESDNTISTTYDMVKLSV